jgi:hypothetical protein
LLEKNSEGTITRREKATLEQLVADAERLTVANAKRLVEFSQSQEVHAPADAVPFERASKSEEAVFRKDSGSLGLPHQPDARAREGSTSRWRVGFVSCPIR